MFPPEAEGRRPAASDLCRPSREVLCLLFYVSHTTWMHTITVYVKWCITFVPSSTALSLVAFRPPLCQILDLLPVCWLIRSCNMPHYCGFIHKCVSDVTGNAVTCVEFIQERTAALERVSGCWSPVSPPSACGQSEDIVAQSAGGRGKVQVHLISYSMFIFLLKAELWIMKIVLTDPRVKHHLLIFCPSSGSRPYMEHDTPLRMLPKIWCWN